MNKNKLYIIVGAIFGIVSLLILVYYLFFTDTNPEVNPNVGQGYPASISQAIDNPLERVTDYYVTLIKDNDFLVSYGGDQKEGIFYITVNAEPVVEVSKRAEQSFLRQFGIDESYACQLTVVLNVPSIVGNNLADYNFGPSFCPGVPHIEDVPQQPREYTRYLENPTPDESDVNNIR